MKQQLDEATDASYSAAQRSRKVRCIFIVLLERRVVTHENQEWAQPVITTRNSSNVYVLLRKNNYFLYSLIFISASAASWHSLSQSAS
jgi:hypothetical protein